MDRVRKINMSGMKPEEIDEISRQLGEKSNSILKKALDEVNDFLNIYGLKAELSLNIKESNTEE